MTRSHRAGRGSGARPVALKLALGALVAAVLGGLAACSLGSAEPARVVVIIASGLRADRVGAYGYLRDTTPHLDARARRGVVFEEARAATPDPEDALHDLLHPGPDALAARAVQAGYRTAAFVDATASGGAAQEGPDLVVPEEWLSDFDEVHRVERGELAQRALAWLENEQDERPRLALVVRADLWPPYAPARGLRARFAGESGAVEGVRATGAARELHRHRKGVRRLSTEDFNYLSDLYDAELRGLDNDLGRLYRALPDALFAFVSETGQALGEDGKIGPGAGAARAPEELLRTPLILFGPDVPKGARDARPARVRDINATIAAHLGFAAPTQPALDRPSAQDLLAKDREAGVLTSVQRDLEPGAAGTRVLYDGRWRLEERAGGARLFDLHEPAHLRRDQANERPEIVEQLRAGVVSPR